MTIPTNAVPSACPKCGRHNYYFDQRMKRYTCPWHDCLHVSEVQSTVTANPSPCPWCSAPGEGLYECGSQHNPYRQARSVRCCEREIEGLKQPNEKHRASYLTVPQQYALNVACKALAPFGYGTFHVGSSLDKPDYHDVDLRCILPDEEYDRMFGMEDNQDARLLFLNVAVSEWIAARSGLPIDFQFQRATQANETFNGRRNAVGH